MTKEEANDWTMKQLWKSLPSSVISNIKNSCLEGLFETTVQKYVLSEEQVEDLKTLGYSVTFDHSDEWNPIYLISWR